MTDNETVTDPCPIYPECHDPKSCVLGSPCRPFDTSDTAPTAPEHRLTRGDRVVVTLMVLVLIALGVVVFVSYFWAGPDRIPLPF